MLKYLIILLDDSSVSFCHYPERKERKLIPVDMLRRAVRFAMIENLNVQFVWPDYELPEEYKEVISSIDHINIVPVSLSNEADILVADPMEFDKCPNGATIVAKLSLSELLDSPELLIPLFKKADRVNILITNPLDFHDRDIEAYRSALKKLSDTVFEELKSGHNIQVNLLTDRMVLTEMNNCNAGHESVTLAVDGKFYICPAFYYDSSKSIGSIDDGIDIKNPQLFRLDHSPICRECDAWHCRRCVWLNKEYTLEVNTPGHEQCVMAHLEREASSELSKNISKLTGKIPGNEIVNLSYLDPFENIINES